MIRYSFKRSELSVLSDFLVELPAPSNLSGWWNLGSLLGLCLVSQVITGIFLAMHYIPSAEDSFDSVVHIVRDIRFGWSMRYFHVNGSSVFFLCLYLHVCRGLYYGSYSSVGVWYSGIVLFFLVMGTAFLGYVLPWGQMSYWGATVITNLLSVMPYAGSDLVQWVWGGYSVSMATLNRFYVFHFLLPFGIIVVSVVHLLSLHQVSSNNPLGISSFSSSVSFHPYYIVKDLFGFVVVYISWFVVVFFLPHALGDPSNFVLADSLVTPIHIKPEWYFLWAYAVLRSIPSKLGGVIAMFSAILVVGLVPAIMVQGFRGFSFYFSGKSLFSLFVGNFILLTWIGGCPVEEPFSSIGQWLTGAYFLFFFFFALFCCEGDKSKGLGY